MSSQCNIKSIVTYIEIRESRILKITHVSQLNGNPTLYEDLLRFGMLGGFIRCLEILVIVGWSTGIQLT